MISQLTRLAPVLMLPSTFAPLGTARADLGRRDGTTALSVDLGLSGAAAAE